MPRRLRINLNLTVLACINIWSVGVDLHAIEKEVYQATGAQSNQNQCPTGCCTGNEILCVSIPCPVSIVLLGIDLTLEIPCIRLASGSPLTGAQIQQTLQVLQTMLNSVSGAVATTGAAKA